MTKKANKKRIKPYQIKNDSYFWLSGNYNYNQIKSNIQSKFDWRTHDFRQMANYQFFNKSCKNNCKFDLSAKTSCNFSERVQTA